MAYTNGLALYVVFPDLYGVNEYTSSNIKYFPIEDGAVFTDTYSETLDTATIKLSNINDTDYLKIENLRVYDTALIYSSTDGVNYTLIKRMLVDEFENRRQRITSTYYHAFTIKLFSETKILEKIILPNIAITKRKTGTPLTIAFYIQQYIVEYSPYKRTVQGTTFSYDRILSLSDDAYAFFNTEYARDMQMNAPTLRQAITELMLVKNCIPVVNNGVVGYLKMDNIGSEISSSQLSNIDSYIKTQSSNQYSNSLNMTLKNVTNNEQEGIDNFVNVSEMIGFRNFDDYILKNPTNLRISTSYPIYDEPKVKICFWGNYTLVNSSGTTLYNQPIYNEVDISDIVFEQQKSNVLPIAFSISASSVYLNMFSQYKNLCLYYSRGSNYIQGFSNTEVDINAVPNFTYYEIQLLYIALLKTLKGQYLSGGQQITDIDTTTQNTDYPNLMFFKVSYQTLSSLKASAGKYLPQRKVIESIDNQNSSYSDSERMGSFEYYKSNRLGNPVDILSGRFSDYGTIPTLGQTYLGSIVYERSIKFQKHSYVVDLNLTEDYILRDYFTGVSSKIRSWVIATGKEALERHDLIKIYAEFSKNQKTDSTVYSIPSYISVTSNYLCYALREYEINATLTINSCASVDRDSNGNVYPYVSGDSTARYWIEPSLNIFGNSLLITMGFYDNFTVAKYISGDYTSSAIGGWYQQDYSYVDSNGENTAYDFDFHYTLNPSGGSTLGTWPYPVTLLTSEQETLMKTLSWEKPLFKSIMSSPAFSSHLEIHKDNREEIKVTNQIEFCSDTKDIVFGKKFLERQKAINLFADVVTVANPKKLITLDQSGSVSPSTTDVGHYAIINGNLFQWSKIKTDVYNWIAVNVKPELQPYYYPYDGKYYQYVNGDFRVVTGKIKAYFFNSEEFNSDYGTPTLPSGGTSVTMTPSLSYPTSVSSHIYFPTEYSSYKSVAICDANDNIILAWNGSPSDGIWLNVKNIRDDYVYDGDSKVGTIVVS